MSFFSRKKKHAELPKVSLISLVDFFTCLIFFLLQIQDLGAGAVVSKDITLPLSISTKEIKASTIVAITPTDVLVEGFSAGKIEEEVRREDLSIPLLEEYLGKIRDRAAKQAAATGAEWEGRLIIQGHKDVSFEILKRVLFTAGKSGFSIMSLAVTRSGGESVGSDMKAASGI